MNSPSSLPTSGTLPPLPQDRDWADMTAIDLRPCTPPAEPAPVPCRCDNCKYGRPFTTGVVLYTRDDAVERLIGLAIRDGRYEDIDAYADAAIARAHLSLNKAERDLARALAPAWRSISRENQRRAMAGTGAVR